MGLKGPPLYLPIVFSLHAIRVVDVHMTVIGRILHGVIVGHDDVFPLTLGMLSTTAIESDVVPCDGKVLVGNHLTMEEIATADHAIQFLFHGGPVDVEEDRVTVFQHGGGDTVGLNVVGKAVPGEVALVFGSNLGSVLGVCDDRLGR